MTNEEKEKHLLETLERMKTGSMTEEDKEKLSAFAKPILSAGNLMGRWKEEIKVKGIKRVALEALLDACYSETEEKEKTNG